jgi:hypothetical protein
VRRLSAGVGVFAATAALSVAARAAQPKHPATFAGGNGKGFPLTFKLDRRARPTYAAVAFACRSDSGALVAHRRKPPWSRSKSGRLTISYAVSEPRLGKVEVVLSTTFLSRTRAKGVATLTNAKCFGKHPGRIRFTATA